jgi:hypothetical protein
MDSNAAADSVIGAVTGFLSDPENKQESARFCLKLAHAIIQASPGGLGAIPPPPSSSATAATPQRCGLIASTSEANRTSNTSSPSSTSSTSDIRDRHVEYKVQSEAVPEPLQEQQIIASAAAEQEAEVQDLKVETEEKEPTEGMEDKILDEKKGEALNAETEEKKGTEDELLDEKEDKDFEDLEKDDSFPASGNQCIRPDPNISASTRRRGRGSTFGKKLQAASTRYVPRILSRELNEVFTLICRFPLLLSKPHQPHHTPLTNTANQHFQHF